MSNLTIKTNIILLGLLFFTLTSYSQQKPKEWNLRTCIDSALQNNIQIQKTQQTVEINKISLEQSRANRLPNLNATAGQSITNQKSTVGSSGQEQSFTGNYSVQSQMVLYNGNKFSNMVAQQQLNVKSSELNVKQSEKDMELTITSAYLKILYARESVKNAENTLISSKTQSDRAKVMFDAGYIAESNYAQVQAQYSSDKYALVVANSTLNEQILQLKQILELGINDSIRIQFPEIDESQVFKALPAKQDVYNSALNIMPEVENSKVGIDAANIDLQIAKAGLCPTLSLNATAATGWNSLYSSNYPTQLGNNFYQNAGLSLSVPIFNNKQVKSSISKAQIAIETAKLTYAETQKSLLTQVETAYLDANTGQERFKAADEQLKATKTSYSLIEQQFNLGMKNTVDLLTEKNKFLTAQQEYLQAKYTAILNFKILDFYQNKPIEL